MLQLDYLSYRRLKALIGLAFGYGPGSLNNSVETLSEHTRYKVRLPL